MKCLIKGKFEKLNVTPEEITVEGNIKVSDSYHNFDELYAHRIILFLSLMKMNKSISWKSKMHHDGEKYEGWFIAGMNLMSGTITYHVPDNFWNQLSCIQTLERAPAYDGHTAEDVMKRLNEWSKTL